METKTFNLFDPDYPERKVEITLTEKGQVLSIKDKKENDKSREE